MSNQGTQQALPVIYLACNTACNSCKNGWGTLLPRNLPVTCCGIDAFRRHLINVENEKKGMMAKISRLKTENANLKMAQMGISQAQESEIDMEDESILLSDGERQVQTSAPKSAASGKQQQPTDGGAGPSTQLSEQLTTAKLESPAIFFVGVRTLASIKNGRSEDNLINTFGGIKYVVWRDHRTKSTEELCDEVRYTMAKYPEVFFHVVFITDRSDIEDAKSKKDVLNAHVRILTSLYNLRTASAQISSLTWTTIIEDTKCEITPSVNRTILESKVVTEGTIRALDIRNMPPECFVRRAQKDGQESYCLAARGVQELTARITEDIEKNSGLTPEDLKVRRDAGIEAFRTKKGAILQKTGVRAQTQTQEEIFDYIAHRLPPVGKNQAKEPGG